MLVLGLVVFLVALYFVVRVAVQDGALDAEQARLALERYEAFERMIDAGELPDATAP